MRDLWVSVRAHRGPLVLALAVTLVASVAALAQPLAARTVVDALSTGATLSGALLVLSGLVLLSAAAIGLGSWILDRTGEHVVRDVRRHGVPTTATVTLGGTYCVVPPQPGSGPGCPGSSPTAPVR